MNNLIIITLLRHQYPAVAHILTHSVCFAFGPKSGSKNICRARDGFRLVISSFKMRPVYNSLLNCALSLAARLKSIPVVPIRQWAIRSAREASPCRSFPRSSKPSSVHLLPRSTRSVLRPPLTRKKCPNAIACTCARIRPRQARKTCGWKTRPRSISNRVSEEAS